MVKIKELPGTKIISGLKGKLDFYYWMGIPVCRSWPSSPGHIRTPAVMEQWQRWGYIAQAWSLLSPDLRAVYEQQAYGTNLSGRDLFQKNFITSSTFVRL